MAQLVFASFLLIHSAPEIGKAIPQSLDHQGSDVPVHMHINISVLL